MELGSEYSLSLMELNEKKDNLFRYLRKYANCFFFDSGRSALRHISNQVEKDTKVLLPEFICDSVIKCFKNIPVTFYRLKPDFTVDIQDLNNKVNEKKSVVFLMHYFGSVQPYIDLCEIRNIADKSNSIIIEDTTHSFFSNSHTIGDYMVCSIRKWLPISGGGVLYYNENKMGLDNPWYNRSSDNYRSYGMILKELFLSNNLDCNSEYRKIFSECERRLNNQNDIMMISDFSRFIISCTSISDIKRKRRENYVLLEKELKELGLIPLVELGLADVPLVYPVRVRDRDNLREYLVNNKIYCAVHWPFDNVCPAKRSFAQRISEEIISLPIDHRYSTEHMYYMIHILKQYGGELRF